MAQECSDAGDFDGWVAARDQARALELEPQAPDGPADRGRRSRTERRTTLSRTGVSAQIGLARRESPSRGARLANASVALVAHLPHTTSDGPSWSYAAPATSRPSCARRSTPRSSAPTSTSPTRPRQVASGHG
jgi:hypothetical protein